LSLLTNGETNKDLAQQMGISPRTVQKHLQRVYAKLRVSGRMEAALVAVRSFSQVE
jgi:DNA-binding NarL/FixJ family response regulator